MRIRFLSVVLLAAACSKPAAKPVYQALAVEKRDIVVSAQASGAIQPDTTVEVKTRASGEVLQILAETGQLVKRGQLLIRIDPRQAKNAVDQSKAQLTLAQAQLDNAKTQLDRSKTLLEAQTITQQEYETAQLAYASASAAVVQARIDDGEQPDLAGGHRRAGRRSPASSSRRAWSAGRWWPPPPSTPAAARC